MSKSVPGYIHYMLMIISAERERQRQRKRKIRRYVSCCCQNNGTFISCHIKRKSSKTQTNINIIIIVGYINKI